MEIAGFYWDEGNQGKCHKHGVSRAEIEELFAKRVMILPDAAHSPSEERLRAIGRTRRGRAIFVVFTIRDHGGRKYIRPISARYMHSEEIAHYEKENPELQDRRGSRTLR